MLNRETKTIFSASLQGLKRCNVVDLSHRKVVNFEIEYNNVRLSETVSDMDYLIYMKRK